ncbi:MAG: Pr6Pr family membrane protein, partial [Vitreimonas sp.]
VWFAATTAAVAVGVVIGLVLSAQNPTFLVDGEQHARFGGSALTRALNNFAFFTIQSNLIVGATSLLLALNPNRPSTVFRVFRLIGLVAITVTFLVFHTAISGLVDLDTWAKTADTLVHTVVPIMAVAGWIMFGPRDLTSARVAKLTVIYPLAYMLFTAIRGPLASDWYPYTFADVTTHGYARVLINALWIGLLFIAIAGTATAVDKRLSGGRAPPPAPAEAAS